MGIHGDALYYSKCPGKHYICCFSPDSGQGYQFFSFMDLSIIALNNQLRSSFDIFCFVFVKACGINVILKFPEVCTGIVFGSPVFLNKFSVTLLIWTSVD